MKKNQIKFVVVVENCNSETTNVGKSVIQGSCLGPSLWLLYVQSLTARLERLGVEFFAYADDITIVKRLKTEQDKLEMEEILSVLQEWAGDYDMEWSPLKTQRLIVGYHKCPTHTPLKCFLVAKKSFPLTPHAPHWEFSLVKQVILKNKEPKSTTP